MKLYAICWQDLTEPWGWEPIDNREALTNFQTFHWSREAAEQALEQVIPALVILRTRGSFYPIKHSDAEADVRREHSVQEYDVPEPPRKQPGSRGPGL